MGKSFSTVEVNIRGRSYQLRSDDKPDYILKLAEMVDQRMLAAEQGTKTVDSGRVAVLAALNLADECCKLEKDYLSRIQELEQERARLLAFVDNVLDEEE